MPFRIRMSEYPVPANRAVSLRVHIVWELWEILVLFVGCTKKTSNIEPSCVIGKVLIHQSLDMRVPVVSSLSLAPPSLSSSSHACWCCLILAWCSCLRLRCWRCWPQNRRRDHWRARWMALLKLFPVGEPCLGVC
jgi:hypothetical protein